MTLPRRLFAAARLAATVASAWAALMMFDLKRLVGFAQIHKSVASCAVRRRTSSMSLDDVVWAVDEACVWYVKRTACLQRSVAATQILRRRGHHAALVIGYRPIPFESHAWVEVGGRVVNDRGQYQGAFKVLDRV